MLSGILKLIFTPRNSHPILMWNSPNKLKRFNGQWTMIGRAVATPTGTLITEDTEVQAFLLKGYKKLPEKPKEVKISNAREV